jgi:hypothetical protein
MKDEDGFQFSVFSFQTKQPVFTENSKLKTVFTLVFLALWRVSRYNPRDGSLGKVDWL